MHAVLCRRAVPLPDRGIDLLGCFAQIRTPGLPCLVSDFVVLCELEAPIGSDIPSFALAAAIRDENGGLVIEFGVKAEMKDPHRKRARTIAPLLRPAPFTLLVPGAYSVNFWVNGMLEDYNAGFELVVGGTPTPAAP